MGIVNDVAKKTFQADGAIGANLLVIYGAAARDVGVAGATDHYAVAGVSEYGVADNQQLSVSLRNKPGTVKLTASAAIAVNTEFKLAASGKIVIHDSTNTEICQGRTLEAAGADGDLIECVLYGNPISRVYS